jgi:hypothetical protein
VFKVLSGLYSTVVTGHVPGPSDVRKIIQPRVMFRRPLPLSAEACHGFMIPSLNTSLPLQFWHGKPWWYPYRRLLQEYNIRGEQFHRCDDQGTPDLLGETIHLAVLCLRVYQVPIALFTTARAVPQGTQAFV